LEGAQAFRRSLRMNRFASPGGSPPGAPPFRRFDAPPPQGPPPAPSEAAAPAGKGKAALYLRVGSLQAEEYGRARRIMDVFDGDFPVVVCTADGKRLLSPRGQWVQMNAPMLAELSRVLGAENVKAVP